MMMLILVGDRKLFAVITNTYYLKPTIHYVQMRRDELKILFKLNKMQFNTDNNTIILQQSFSVIL